MNDKLDFDSAVERWLAQPGPPLADRVIDQAIDRVRSTPQRRRWWRWRWSSKRVGATRSADHDGDRDEGGSRTMLTALSVTTAAAILAVGGSLALIGSQLAPSERPAVEPAALTSPSPAPEPTPDPAVGVRVKGTGGGAVLEYGDIAGTELRDRVATTLYIVADDPRVMGEDRFVHHADNHDGVGPEWGAYRLENADGAWQGVLTGYFDGPETRLNGWLTGEGAYDGLTYYLEYVLDNYSFQVDIEGIIYPGEPPSDPPAVEPWELAARVTSE